LLRRPLAKQLQRLLVWRRRINLDRAQHRPQVFFFSITALLVVHK
jgi:hypothetical protein